MGLLSTNALSSLFGRVFSAIYEDGVLIKVSKVRNDDGSLREVTSQHDVKVQFDKLGENTDPALVRASKSQTIFVLRDGLRVEVNNDDRIAARGAEWFISGVTTDPASSHYVTTGTRK